MNQLKDLCASLGITATAQFETNLSSMTATIQASYPKRVAKMLTPNATAERAAHVACAAAGTSCSCRVCYWSKGQ